MSPFVLAATTSQVVIGLLILFASIIVIGMAFIMVASKFYIKVGPDEAIVKTGMGGMNVIIDGGALVWPVIHRYEKMDLTLKSFEIAREGSEGLICKDNIRADIKCAFFIRVDKTTEEIKEVAQSIGCKRASVVETLRELFDAKFSEALKTVGKQFEFVELYDKRDKFKNEILKVIGTDLNGYRLDDCAIDYLEQTRLELLNPNNILDAEGIKKITELTSAEKVKENHFTREREKTLKKQDVEAAEAILELERQRIEAFERQKREVAEIQARENATAAKVVEENRLASERAKIAADEEIGIATENKHRTILVAQRNKERTDAVEIERILRDKTLEATERERVVGLAAVEKDKALETEKRNIQEVIRERVIVERSVVEEQQKIKDTEAFASADRTKRVEVTAAEMAAEQSLVREIKAAEAAKKASESFAAKVRIESEAHRDEAEQNAAAIKIMAEAKRAEHAASGLAEAEVMQAKAGATQEQGLAEARVLRGGEHRDERHHGVGREHEEFKLRLEKEKQIEITGIQAQKSIAESQALVIGEALKTAKIDIVGGDGEFFKQVSSAVQGGKALDRFVLSSSVATDIKETFFNGSPEYFKEQLAGLLDQLHLKSSDVRDLSVAAFVAKMLGDGDSNIQSQLVNLLGLAGNLNLANKPISGLLEKK